MKEVEMTCPFKMCYGICNLSIIPVRENASERAEMVTQLLFGEAYQVVGSDQNWLKIKICDDGYEGWIDAKLFNPLHEIDVEPYLSSDKYLLKDILLFIKEFESNITFPIFAGSSFPYPKDRILILGDSIFVVDLPEEKEHLPHPRLSPDQYALLRFASTYLEAPYLWGGRSPAGIDCSGLVQILYKSIGILLPRDASQQVSQGEVVDFIEEAKVGDVAFFQDEEGKIIHTGIIIGEGQIIHSSGKVRIDLIDSTGIYNKKADKYTHFSRVIKRYLHENA